MKKQIREQDIYYFDSGEQEDTALCAGMLRQMIAEIMRRVIGKVSCSFALVQIAPQETVWDR